MAYTGSYHPNEESEVTPAAEPEIQRESPPKSRERRSPFDLASLFQKTEVAGMETDDLLMALVLYLMYRESGDTDLLVMLGVMLLT